MEDKNVVNTLYAQEGTYNCFFNCCKYWGRKCTC